MDLKALLGDKYKENMTLEEINQALADKNLVDPATLGDTVLKTTFDKTASELAKAKKDLQAKLTEDEQKKAEQDALAERIANMEKENSMMKLEKEFIGNGYDDKTATSLAKALSENNMAEFTKLNATFMTAKQEALKVSIKEELLKATPGLIGGGGGADDKDSAGAEAAKMYSSQFITPTETK